jgi:hypothetical protein
MQAQIYFKPTEVPLGTKVRFCIPGSDKPVDDVPALTCLLGADCRTARLYVMTGKNPSIFGDCNSFIEGVRFVPDATYTTKTAPEKMEFIVYSDSSWLKYEAYPDYRMLVTKLADGTFMSVCGYAYKHWLRRIKLPKGARLVSTGECEYLRTVDDATLLFVEPRSEEWVLLEKAGCTFYKEQFGNFVGKNPYHVWMPKGWSLVKNDRVVMGGEGCEYDIKDGVGKIQAYAIFFPWEGKQSGTVAIRDKAKV